MEIRLITITRALNVEFSLLPRCNLLSYNMSFVTTRRLVFLSVGEEGAEPEEIVFAEENLIVVGKWYLRLHRKYNIDKTVIKRPSHIFVSQSIGCAQQVLQVPEWLQTLQTKVRPTRIFGFWLLNNHFSTLESPFSGRLWIFNSAKK